MYFLSTIHESNDITLLDHSTDMAGILGNQYDTDSDEEDNGSDNNG